MFAAASRTAWSIMLQPLRLLLAEPAELFRLRPGALLHLVEGDREAALRAIGDLPAQRLVHFGQAPAQYLAVAFERVEAAGKIGFAAPRRPALRVHLRDQPEEQAEIDHPQNDEDKR